MTQEDLDLLIDAYVTRGGDRYRLDKGKLRDLLQEFSHALAVTLDPEDTGPVVRFYAETFAFRLICPSCQRLIYIGAPTKLIRSFAEDQAGYNKAEQTLICRGCDKKYQVGLILWSWRKGGIEARPKDTKMGYRAMAELRDRARGVWAEQERMRGEPVNMTDPNTETD